MMQNVTEQREIRRRVSRQQALGPGINPRSLSKPARYRFERDRRTKYLARISGAPSDRQVALIDSIIRLEWASLVAEAEGGLIGLREAREHRRLFQRLLDDFEKSLTPPAMAKPGPPQLDLDQHLGKLGQRERREGAS